MYRDREIAEISAWMACMACEICHKTLLEINIFIYNTYILAFTHFALNTITDLPQASTWLLLSLQ